MVKKSVLLVICVLNLLTMELCSAANVGGSCRSGTADCTVADSECSSGTCKCVDETHYNTSATSCVKKGGFGEVCDTAIGDGTCLYSLRCIANECQCEKPAIQFFSENICKFKIVLAAFCTPGPTDQCLDANAECKKDTDMIDKCLCKTNYKISNDACVASHGIREMSPNLILTVVCVIGTVVYKILK